MPHAVMRICNMSDTVVRDFYFSFPEDLCHQFMNKVTSVGLHPRISDGNRMTFESLLGHQPVDLRFMPVGNTMADLRPGVELYAVLDWMEKFGYHVTQLAESAIDAWCVSTYVFKKK